MSVRGLPGISSKASVVLDAAIDYVHGAEPRTVAGFGKEVGGLFIQSPEAYLLTHGWTSTPEFSPFPRHERTGDAPGQGSGDIGRLTITPGDVSAKAEILMELRSMITNTTIAREGWNAVKTPWSDVVRQRVEAMWESEMLVGAGYTSLEHAVDVTMDTVRDHLASGFKGYNGDDSSVVLPHIGAYDFLMMTGPAILVGMLHTHPRGNSDTSPEDMISAQAFTYYQKALVYNPEHLMDAGYEGGCESGAVTQHWILALNTGGWVKSLTRFTAGRKMAVIEGNFLQ